MNEIKELRRRTGKTQKEFGEVLGIPPRTIGNWETGTKSPPPYVIDLIAFYLKANNLIK